MFMKLPSKIVFINDHVEKSFNDLNKKGKIYKSLSKAFQTIENNAFSGIQIPKKLIPRNYLKKYGIHNLWKYNLPDGWRLIYSIESKHIIVVSLVIDWMNHKDYEQTFNYIFSLTASFM